MTNYPLPLQCESCGILIAHFDLTEHFFTELMQCLFNGCSYRSICRISMSLHFNQHLHGKKVTMFEYEIIIRHRYKLLYMDPSSFWNLESSIRDRLSSFFNDQTFMIKEFGSTNRI
ncbi:hypothetical protein BLOT_011446 [Blomia tropicalis]|nr:hypothetical protein BLOT_011446 [Blomia tropicalis]